MLTIIKISLFCMVGVLVALQIKGANPGFSTYIGIAIGVVLFVFCVGEIGNVVDMLGDLFQNLGNAGGYLQILLKVMGITYICEFSSGICRDAGFHTVSEQINVLGKVSVMISGLPILFAVVEQIQAFL